MEVFLLQANNTHMAYLISATVITLSVLEVIPILQAF